MDTIILDIDINYFILLAIAPMADCDNIGVVDSKKIIFTRYR